MIDSFIGNAAPLSAQGVNTVITGLGVDAPTLWSLVTVETKGCGFLADKRPKVVFERHIFHKLTDGRFSGATHGFMVGHVCPEAACGGPIALVRDGDRVRIDATTRTIDVLADLDARRADHVPRKQTKLPIVLAKYAASVSPASQGAVTIDRGTAGEAGDDR